MIVFDDNLLAIWHVFIPKQPSQAKSDFMAALSRGGGVDPHVFRLVYRFRYYEDDKAFDSKDRKNWYEGTLRGYESDVIAKVRQVVAVLTVLSDGPVDELLRGDMDTDAFLEELAKRPWAHLQRLPAHPTGHA